MYVFRLLVKALIVFQLTLVWGCATPIGDIDRTQAGKLKKSALSGEWYFRQTVIDVPFTSGLTFIGEQSVLERVRFEVSEDFLTAYRSYERVTDSEIPSKSEQFYQGAPIAAYAIQSHFDVNREYNSATGEQTNVLVENPVDRPWYDRAYIRVDWSRNLLGNFDFMAAGVTGLGVSSQPASFVVTDPRDPDAPVFATRQAGGWNDVRNPFEWGELDTVDYFDVTNKLQLSPETFAIDYGDGSSEQIPACWFYEFGPWDCASQTIKVRASFMKIGTSDYEALSYPDNEIMRDAEGDPIRVDWDPESNRPIRCEDSSCPIARVPMFDRFGFFRIERETYDRNYGVTEAGRQYWINRFDIWEGEDDDLSLKPIVYYLSPNFPEDLIPAAEEVGSWWSDAFVETAQSKGVNAARGFEVRKNSFAADAEGNILDHGQRNGDLRYSHLYWVDEPQFESLLGYGPAAVDPLNGEIISADAYVYGAAIDVYATYGADVVDLIRGEIDESDYIEGIDVSTAVRRLSQPPRPAGEEMRALVKKKWNGGMKARVQGIRERGRDAYQAQNNYTRSRMKLADQSPLADRRYHREIQQAYEARLGRRPSSEEIGGGQLAKAWKRHRRDLGKRALDFRHFDDGAVVGLAQDLVGLSREDVVAQVRRSIFQSTAAHEVGHTLGLRHNFAGSSDALNYHDEYWDIRNPIAQPLDLPSEAEENEGLRQYSYSSIMDYSARFSGDIKGLGKYDRSAIKFGYGELVEVFANSPTAGSQEILAETTLDDALLNATHYSSLRGFFGQGGSDGILNIRNRNTVSLGQWRSYLTGDPSAPNLSDRVVPYRFCSDEYAGALWYCDLYDEGADPYEIVSYATQVWRDYYIFESFKRHRRFVDPLEYYFGSYSQVMQPLVSQYQQWLFGQWYDSADWDYYSFLDSDFGTNITEGSDWTLDPNYGLSGTAAAMTAINFFAEVMATPEPGSYYFEPSADSLVWYAEGEDPICSTEEDSLVDLCADAYVPVGDGRYVYSLFDDASGYYFYERLNVVGSYWDKLAAIEAMADPSTFFLGVDDSANSASFLLGFNVVFPKEVNTLFGSVAAGDFRGFGYQLEADGSLTPPQYFDPASGSPSLDVSARPGPFVDPGGGFNTSIDALFYGMALLNANFDQSFNDHAKIWVEGSGEALAPATGADVATFIHPGNGRTYQSVAAADPDAYSLGHVLVNRAQAHADELAAAGPDCYYSQVGACADLDSTRVLLQETVETIELLRGYYNIFGYSAF